MILVTGATGHVGRTVVCRLASLGHDVVAMVRDVQAASRRLPSGIALRVADYEEDMPTLCNFVNRAELDSAAVNGHRASRA